MSSSSSSSSEGEWEDVESFHPVYGAKDGEGSKSTAVEIVLPAKGSIHKGKRKNALEKAMEAFDRELRYGLHKTSLLCLLGQGLRMNTASCDPLLQAKATLPRTARTPPEHIRKTALKDDGETEGGSLEVSGVSLSPVQLLVAVLRVLGLRARLVLALNPISFRPSRQKNSDSLTIRDTDTSTNLDSGGKLPETKSSLLGHRGEDSAPQPGPHFFRLMEQLKQSAGREAGMDGSSEANTTKTEGEGESGRRGRGRGKRRSSESVESGIGKRRKLSCGKSDTSEKRSTPPNKSSTAGSKGKGKQRKEKRTPTTASETSPYFSETSPYFSSQGKTSCGASNTDGGSGSDSDFVPPKRKAKRLCLEAVVRGVRVRVGRGRKERMERQGRR
ncbi:hypothetical protein GBAR_LOCUS7925 [Geodia barretti]|uniref:Uncharacterized protein n=1 Tax=Geodia barretti TaxID=519541 RepID=A0AA35RIX0_GEOBA|nr:hypothetical protein GBAR_LOCUS7925 [Geodia barretti]